ncbi:MAG: helix-turn-helix domain-containing protein [Erythrobacter sp.]|nr:helix-turn-helix domain-containing protein [Erythrobacter sp.]
MDRFLGNGPFKDAYLGKHAYDLMVQTSDQMEVVYAQRGLLIPLQVSSVLHFLAAHDGSSMADIGAALNLPHQLVAQRVSKLLSLGLVERRPATDDRRRIELYLTDSGQEQGRLLVDCMAETAKVYRSLFEEIGCNLVSALLAASNRLESKPLAERFEEAVKAASQHDSTEN